MDSTMSSSSSTLDLQVELGNTFGALFIGVVLAAILFGLGSVQAFIYFQTHTGTGTIFYKLVVVFLWILDALHLTFIIHCIYYSLVINYANIDALTYVVWSFKLQVVVGVLIISGVHILYVHRIWIVSQGRPRAFPVIVAIFVFLCSGAFIVLIWAVCVSTEEINYEWALYLALGSSTSIDILIASSLCYLLATSRTGFSNTDTFISKLMGYIINTGCLTSICSLASIITCAVMPKSFIYLGVEFLLAKLYINSYIALLNARYYLQSNTDVTDLTEPPIRYNVHNPQNDTPQASQKSLIEHEVVHPIRPVQVVRVSHCITLGKRKTKWCALTMTAACVDGGDGFFLCGVDGFFLCSVNGEYYCQCQLLPFGTAVSIFFCKGLVFILVKFVESSVNAD
ncbi:hypothetical protein M405DRAFT_349914 [Rhizopogon salebrosus TDB-379]|nr:hypothetical protein M405DRAFT_349914 [Rhizopogon salebrosus TDB-379]